MGINMNVAVDRPMDSLYIQQTSSHLSYVHDQKTSSHRNADLSTNAKSRPLAMLDLLYKTLDGPLKTHKNT